MDDNIVEAIGFLDSACELLDAGAYDSGNERLRIANGYALIAIAEQLEKLNQALTGDGVNVWTKRSGGES